MSQVKRGEAAGLLYCHVVAERHMGYTILSRVLCPTTTAHSSALLMTAMMCWRQRNDPEIGAVLVHRKDQGPDVPQALVRTLLGFDVRNGVIYKTNFTTTVET